jgi:hypothetical protein
LKFFGCEDRYASNDLRGRLVQEVFTRIRFAALSASHRDLGGYALRVFGIARASDCIFDCYPIEMPLRSANRGFVLGEESRVGDILKCAILMRDGGERLDAPIVTDRNRSAFTLRVTGY